MPIPARRWQAQHRLLDSLDGVCSRVVISTIELLVDKELESRQGRAIERRFKNSRLQAQPSIDAFHFPPSQEPVQAKKRILRLLMVLIGDPGVGKTFLARLFGWKACQATSVCCSPPRWKCPSQADHSLVRKLKLARGVRRSSRRTRRSLTGATFSSIPPWQATGWWRTLTIFCLRRDGKNSPPPEE